LLAGTYTFELRRVSTETVGGREWTWVADTVIDRASKERVRIATLRFPGARLRLKPRFASFVEFYGGKKVDIAKLPPLEIRFGVPCFQPTGRRWSAGCTTGPSRAASTRASFLLSRTS